MRYTVFAAIALAIGIATPAFSAKNHAAPAAGPTWDDCYDLAWIRGVHAEQGELPDFVEQCTAGKIPFGDDFVRFYKRNASKKFSG